MLNRLGLRHSRVDAERLHHVSADGTRKEAADELRHLNHRDRVEQHVNRHTECRKQQAGRECVNHARVVEGRLHAGSLCLRLVVRVSLEALARNQVSRNRAANQGAHDVAERTGRDTDRRRIRRAHLLEDRAERGSRADTAGHRSRGALECEQRIHADCMCECNAEDVLQRNQQASRERNHDAELATRILQHLRAEAVAHAKEEEVLAKVLHNLCVEGELHNARALDAGNHQREDEARDNRCRDCILLQCLGLRHEEASEEDDQRCESECRQILELEAGKLTRLCCGVLAKVTHECFHNFPLSRLETVAV